MEPAGELEPDVLQGALSRDSSASEIPYLSVQQHRILVFYWGLNRVLAVCRTQSKPVLLLQPNRSLPVPSTLFPENYSWYKVNEVLYPQQILSPAPACGTYAELEMQVKIALVTLFLYNPLLEL